MGSLLSPAVSQRAINLPTPFRKVLRFLEKFRRVSGKLKLAQTDQKACSYWAKAHCKRYEDNKNNPPWTSFRSALPREANWPRQHPRSRRPRNSPFQAGAWNNSRNCVFQLPDMFWETLKGISSHLFPFKSTTAHAGEHVWQQTP